MKGSSRKLFVMLTAVFLFSSYLWSDEDKREPIERTIGKDVPKKHKKINEILGKIKKIKKDDKGNFVVTLDSGYVHEGMSKHKVIYSIKATMKMSGNSASNITFSYKKYNMGSQIEETKTIQNNRLDSSDLKSLKILYKNSAGENSSYTLGDFPDSDSQVKVLFQYNKYLDELLYYLQKYANRVDYNEIKRIEHIIHMDL